MIGTNDQTEEQYDQVTTGIGFDPETIAERFRASLKERDSPKGPRPLRERLNAMESLMDTLGLMGDAQGYLDDGGAEAAHVVCTDHDRIRRALQMILLLGYMSYEEMEAVFEACRHLD